MPAAKRQVITAVREHAVSLRCVCGLMQLGRSSYYYEVQPDHDGALRQWLRQRASQRRGYTPEADKQRPRGRGRAALEIRQA
ncbi:MAG TPA: hypothetical protein VMP11_01055 [Verrucomicrobiae bacterium]|nr:hypothetical protein [Verrucomicrobiae bacterium]